MIALSINGRDVYLPGAAPDFGHRIEVLHPHVIDRRTRRPWKGTDQIRAEIHGKGSA